MRYLLDSHVLLWCSTQRSPLSAEHLELLSDPRHELYLSVVSVWELAIKRRSGKLQFSGSFHVAAQLFGMSILPVTLEHAEEAERLPQFHRDPFDHMLIAQTRVEGLILVTHDDAIRRYDVPLLRV